jgi:aryl-alcohol dehydrogenase-like predicted oxidoreductase
MPSRTLGRTGWNVSEIGCGTYRSFDQSGAAGQRAVTALVQANLAAGVNLFDTAPMYGRAERTLGEALAQLGLKQPGQPLVATKVLQSDRAGAVRQIEESFSLLHRIELLQIHNMAGWRPVLPYLSELRASGRIAAIGVTHYDTGGFGEMEAACKTGIPDVIQVPLNLIEREAERRLLPLARELNLGVLVMTPIEPIFQRKGILSALRGFDLKPYAEYGVTDAGSLCLKWLLSKFPDVVPIPATSKEARVRSNLAASGTPALPPELMTRVEQHVSG